MSNDQTSSRFTQTFVGQLHQRKLLRRNSFPTPYFSPFSTLELLGLSTRVLAWGNTEPQKIMPMLKGLEDPEEAKRIVHEHYKNHFASCPDLEKNRLLARSEEMARNSMSPAGRFTLSLLEKSIAAAKETHLFIEAIALDRVMSFQYPSSLIERIGASFMVDIVRSVSNESNVSLARGNHVFAQAKLAKKRREKDVVNLPLVQELADRTQVSQFRASKDLVDADLIHFAVCGIYKNPRRRATICLTTDSPDEIRHRIVIYRNVLALAYKTCRAMERIRELPFDVQDSVPGSIGFVSDDGAINSIEHVKHIGR